MRAWQLQHWCFYITFLKNSYKHACNFFFNYNLCICSTRCGIHGKESQLDYMRQCLTCNFVNNFGEDKTRPPPRHVVLRSPRTHFEFEITPGVETRKIVDISPREIPEYPKRRTTISPGCSRKWSSRNRVCVLNAQEAVLFFTHGKKKGKIRKEEKGENQITHITQ